MGIGGLSSCDHGAVRSGNVDDIARGEFTGGVGYANGQ